MTEIHGFICGPRLYSYKGWYFELSPSCGPWPLRKDGEPRARAGRRFYQVFDEWQRLPKRKREKCRIGGGCIRF
jgi:hypothetical protein